MRTSVTSGFSRRVIAPLFFNLLFTVLYRTGVQAADPSLQNRIQRLEDHEAIQELLIEYGRTLDAGDYKAYGNLFAVDGEWSGSFGSFKGPEAITKSIGESMRAPDSAARNVGAFHLLTNAIIDVQGDHATASSKWTFVRMTDKQPVLVLSGRYEDVLVREKGHWRFQRRVAKSALDPL